jgi:maltose alpha-D-glucosyltransferase/alpha-amylase
MLRLVDTKYDLLERNMHRISGSLQKDAREMLKSREQVKQFFTNVLQRPMEGKRIRIHGDYHLGQVLVTGYDFCILDFEGEPDKPHAERRDKYPPLKDVAGMMRSFRYAAYAVLFQHYDTDPDLRDKLMRVADVWYHFASRYFLGEYIQTAKDSELLPSDEKINDLLQVYSFKKAIYELGYEINNRPDWAVIPLQSLVKFVKHYLDA